MTEAMFLMSILKYVKFTYYTIKIENYTGGLKKKKGKK